MPLVRTIARRRRARRGMTLIEIIVVITIISLLMGAVAVAVIPQLNKAKQDTARNDIQVIMSALDIYYMRNNKYPAAGTSLQTLYEQQILKKEPVDPWGFEYKYLLENGKPVVKSYGEDGSAGGEDLAADISSNEAKKK